MTQESRRIKPARGAGGDEAAVVRHPDGEPGVNTDLNVACPAAGMAARADSIDDTGPLRHGAMSTLSGGIRAPSTLGSHLLSDPRREFN